LLFDLKLKVNDILLYFILRLRLYWVYFTHVSFPFAFDLTFNDILLHSISGLGFTSFYITNTVHIHLSFSVLRHLTTFQQLQFTDTSFQVRHISFHDLRFKTPKLTK
jgi:hypothetical protein